ncbi:hypothetical protein L484_025909 [Morus notabilis]|uniref:Brf1 TBP-binding domain-containing protein n=1 Tax=Morus notabilis TaxID=981085 RepID=W9RFL0_9ROSA|nr:hypothetical protein L484_025909 [Morus notabilis]
MISGVYNEDDESESFSDIDDAEVCKYLNNKKEARYKRMIWEAMNKDHQKCADVIHMLAVPRLLQQRGDTNPANNVTKPVAKYGIRSKIFKN